MERQRDRQTDRGRQRQTETDRDRETQRENWYFIPSVKKKKMSLVMTLPRQPGTRKV